MGTQFCKDTTHTQENQLRNMGNRENPVLNCCYTPPKPCSKIKDEIIGPIQFSDLGSPQNTPDKVKTKSDFSGGTNISGNMQQNPIATANWQRETNQNYKQHKTAPNTGNKILSNEKKQVSGVIQSPNLSDVKIELVQFQKINVPFSVIRLILKPQILKLIKIVDRDFEKIHGDPKCQTFHSWKLHQKGFYFNQLSNLTTIVITDQYYYQGNLTGQFSKASGKNNILIDDRGAFQGQFKEGFADGYGEYVSLNGKKKYKGLWKFGRLEKGTLQTDTYQYEGELKHCLPHGKGKLHLFNKHITYKGHFADGMFQGEGQYECQAYRYKGHFKKGKKNGMGELIEKQRLGNKEQSNIKFKAPRKFKGQFKEDVITLNKVYK